MDAIVFERPREILYREHGAHAYAPGTDRVRTVHPQCLPPPAPLSRPALENLCGHFCTYYEAAAHRQVQHRSRWLFGRPHEMYHLDGNAYAYGGRVHFRASRGTDALERLADALELGSPACAVTMCAVRFGLGRRVHTGHGSYLETSVQHRLPGLRVCCRMLDNNAAVKLRIDRFGGRDVPFFDAPDTRPVRADLTVSGRGVVVARVTWRACPWDRGCEAHLLAFCTWLRDALRDSC